MEVKAKAHCCEQQKSSEVSQVVRTDTVVDPLEESGDGHSSL